jgi:PEP-CTERM motif
MSKTRVVTGLLSAVFVLTLVSSARADSLHADMFLEKLVYAENHHLTVLDNQSAGIDYLYTGHFENNNGKHLGFSMTSVQRGPRFGIVKPLSPDSATPNPEPTAMVLLGTGLAAIAAVARKRSRSRRL